MARQEELQDVLPGLGHQRGDGAHDKALLGERRAPGHRLRAEVDDRFTGLVQHHLARLAVAARPPDLDEAHPAHAHGLELGVVAEDRDLDAQPIRHVDDGRSLGDGHLAPVHAHRDEVRGGRRRPGLGAHDGLRAHAGSAFAPAAARTAEGAT